MEDAAEKESEDIGRGGEKVRGSEPSPPPHVSLLLVLYSPASLSLSFLPFSAVEWRF